MAKRNSKLSNNFLEGGQYDSKNDKMDQRKKRKEDKKLRSMGIEKSI
jgi:hypothetical protein